MNDKAIQNQRRLLALRYLQSDLVRGSLREADCPGADVIRLARLERLRTEYRPRRVEHEATCPGPPESAPPLQTGPFPKDHWAVRLDGGCWSRRPPVKGAMRTLVCEEDASGCSVTLIHQDQRISARGRCCSDMAVCETETSYEIWPRRSVAAE